MCSEVATGGVPPEKQQSPSRYTLVRTTAVGRPVGRSIGRPIGRSVGRSVGRPDEGGTLRLAHTLGVASDDGGGDLCVWTVLVRGRRGERRGEGVEGG